MFKDHCIIWRTHGYFQVPDPDALNPSWTMSLYLRQLLLSLFDDTFHSFFGHNQDIRWFIRSFYTFKPHHFITMARNTRQRRSPRTTASTTRTRRSGSTTQAASASTGATTGGSSSASANTTGGSSSVTFAVTNPDLKAKLEQFGYSSDEADWMMSDGGLGDLANWNMITPESLSSIAKSTRRLATNPFEINTITMARTTAFLYWVQHQILMGFEPDAIDLGDYDNDRAREYIAFQKDDGKFKFQDIDMPGSFTCPTNYLTFLDALRNKCANTAGSHGFGINYLLRDNKDRPSDSDLSTARAQVQFLWLAPHSGDQFEDDSRQLWSILTASLQDSTVWDVIKSLSKKQDGYGAMVKINRSMLGKGAVQNLISHAQAGLKNLKYHDERTFSFTDYHAKMVGHFDMLENAGAAYTPLLKVEKLLGGIQNVTNNALKQEINTIKSDYADRFDDAFNKLQAVIAREFPKDNNTGKRTISSVQEENKKEQKKAARKAKEAKKRADLKRYYAGLSPPLQDGRSVQASANANTNQFDTRRYCNGVLMDWLAQDQRCPNQEDWNQRIPDQMKACIIELYKLRKWKNNNGGKKVSVLQTTESLEQPDPVPDNARSIAAASSSGGGGRNVKSSGGTPLFKRSLRILGELAKRVRFLADSSSNSSPPHVLLWLHLTEIFGTPPIGDSTAIKNIRLRLFHPTCR